MKAFNSILGGDDLKKLIVAMVLSLSFIFGGSVVPFANPALASATTSSAPCGFENGVVTTCQSSNPQVVVLFDVVGDFSQCTLSIQINWGDGTVQNITGPFFNHVDHLYSASSGTFQIEWTGSVSGVCVFPPANTPGSSSGSYQFTLLPSLSITFAAAPPSKVPPTVYQRTGCNLAARVNVPRNRMEFTVVVKGQPSAHPLTVHVNDSSQNGGSGHGPGGHPVVRPHGWLFQTTDTQPITNDAIGGSQDTAGLNVQTNAGQATFVWLPPEIAGAETITVSIVGHPDVAPAVANIDVKIDGLEPMPFDPELYQLVGNEQPGFGDLHPSNHWATHATVKALQTAAQNYINNQQNDTKLQDILTQLTNKGYGFPAGFSDLMKINDISLPWGGLFDIHGDWTTPHCGHRWGNMADLRTNYLVGDPLHPQKTALRDPNAPPPISNLVRRAHLRMFQLLVDALTAVVGTKNVQFEGADPAHGIFPHIHVVFPA